MNHTETDQEVSAFRFGRAVGHIETLTQEFRDLRAHVATKVSHAEFQRAVRVIMALNVITLGAIVTLAFKAIHP